MWWPYSCRRLLWSIFFFFNDTATTEIYTLSLHDALPISLRCRARTGRRGRVDRRRRHDAVRAIHRRRRNLSGDVGDDGLREAFSLDLRQDGRGGWRGSRVVFGRGGPGEGERPSARGCGGGG